VKTGRGIASPFVEVEFVGCDYDNNKYKTSPACMSLSVLYHSSDNNRFLLAFLMPNIFAETL